VKMIQRWGWLLVFLMLWAPIVAVFLLTGSLVLALGLGIPATVLLWWIGKQW